MVWDPIIRGKPEPKCQRNGIGGISLEQHELGAGWQRRWSRGPRQCGCVRDDDLGRWGRRGLGLAREGRGNDGQNSERDGGTERHGSLQVVGYLILAPPSP